MTTENTDRIADALERIAAALERAYPLDLRDSGLTRAWDDAEIARDPNRCEPGCIRPSLHDGDCDMRAVADPLDESDHRVRHVSGSEHLWWREDCGRWHVLRREGGCTCNGRDPHVRPLTPADPLFRLEWWADGDTLTFCDCPDPVVTEAENRAGDR